MNVKDIAKQVIDSLPDEASMDEIIHALYVKMKFEAGKLENGEGKGFFHQETKQRFQKWIN
ncbi:MAG TPA: hypothetical protein VHY08_10355 [Bacillota bacterium]|nr:hypothetical protein [Bacillota bacterium]